MEQQEYYDENVIKARLSKALGTDNWENIKNSDLGDALLTFGANVVHQTAMGFFIGLDQLFISENTLPGYLEAIAKSKGVLANTYTSATIKVVLRAKSSSVSYSPLDFSVTVGGVAFYNIESLALTQSLSVVTLYQGSVVRESTKSGKFSTNLWSYTQNKSPIPVKVGNRTLREYFLLPTNAFIDSLIVESFTDFKDTPVRWFRLEQWSDATSLSRAYLVEKDYISRYKVIFGDGVYGKELPSTEIVGLRYLVSKGDAIELSDFSSYVVKYQDSQDLSAAVEISSITDFVRGSSVVDYTSLLRKVEKKETSRDSIVRLDEIQLYLESRDDVVHASVISERHLDPPNISMFNTVNFVLKASAPDLIVNIDDAKTFLYKNSVETLEFESVGLAQIKFDVDTAFSVIPGYASGVIASAMKSTVEEKFKWISLGFEEVMTPYRVNSLFSSVEGLKQSSLITKIFAYYTSKTDGSIVQNLPASTEDMLDFIPSRYGVRVVAPSKFGSYIMKDNGLGVVYGDYLGAERLGHFSVETLVKNRFVLTYKSAGSSYFMLVDADKSSGGVAKLSVATAFNRACLANTYNQLYTYSNALQQLIVYRMPHSLTDRSSINYAQLYDNKELVEEYRTSLPATGAVVGMHLYGTTLYLVTHSAGNTRIVTCSVSSNSIRDVQSTASFASAEPTGVNVVDTVVSGTSRAYIPTKSGIIVAYELHTTSEAIEVDFFNDSLECYGIAFDTNTSFVTLVRNSVAGKSYVYRYAALGSEGTAAKSKVSEDVDANLRGLSYIWSEYYNRIYSVSLSGELIYVPSVGIAQAWSSRIPSSTDADTPSLRAVVSVDYESKFFTVLDSFSDISISYEAAEIMQFSKYATPVLNTVSVYEG